MPLNTLLVERADGITIVSFNRPNVLNALSPEMTEELSQFIEESEQDSTARAVMFTGVGDRAFMAGADVKTFPALTPLEALERSRRIQSLFTRVERLPQPTRPQAAWRTGPGRARSAQTVSARASLRCERNCVTSQGLTAGIVFWFLMFVNNAG